MDVKWTLKLLSLNQQSTRYYMKMLDHLYKRWLFLSPIFSFLLLCSLTSYHRMTPSIHNDHFIIFFPPGELATSIQKLLLPFDYVTWMIFLLIFFIAFLVVTLVTTSEFSGVLRFITSWLVKMWKLPQWTFSRFSWAFQWHLYRKKTFPGPFWWYLFCIVWLWGTLIGFQMNRFKLKIFYNYRTAYQRKYFEFLIGDGCQK